MNSKLLNTFAVASVVMLAATAAVAQSAYFNAITNLNPAGYWPMHEVEAAAQGDTETNYGTLGLLGTGYYPDWAVATPGIKRGVPGAITGDSGDTAVNFTRGGNPAAGIYTNALYVPHTSPLSTLTPPFSVECWFFPTNTASDDIWAQSGDEGLNFGGNAGGNAGSLAGIRFVWGNGTNTGFQIFNLNGGQNSAGFAGNVGGAVAYPTDNWYHVVLTCDAGTNFSLYVNGNFAPFYSTTITSNGPGSYTPDYWTPLTIGSGRGGTRACAGYVDEFAVYTNVIGDANTHYNAGISGGAGAYFHDVTNDNPVIYLRMDAPVAYAPPDVSTWPALTNDGSVAANGVYTPGTVPGIVTSPPVNPNGVPFGGVPGKIAQLSSVGTFGDAGYDPTYNPTGSNANFTVTALFKGNPCDNRVQSIAGHGTNSWQLGITTAGKIVFNAGNGNKAAGGIGSSAGDIQTVGVYNDGKWHQVVAVNATNVISIYVDGLLDTNGTPTGIAVTNIIAGNSSDVMIGSDPTYTNLPTGAGRSFAGQICDVAVFTNALTTAQIQTLYSNCQVAAYITGQPIAGRAVNGGPGTYIYFGVIANGSPNLAYQWYFNTSSNYSGATKLVDGAKYTGSTTLQVTVTNLANADSGYYYVVVTNNYGSATSILASLAAYGSPTILSQFPITYTNQFTLYAGASPTFSISAAGGQPIDYYWFTNSVLDAAATSSSMVWTNVQTGSVTGYCIASNFAGSATSMVWTASVIVAPNAPYPTNVLALNPIGYWRLNEQDDGQSDGDAGVVAVDYAGGNDGIYTNVILGNPGYSATDPSDTSVEFGEYGSIDSAGHARNNDAGQIQGIDFAATNGANGEFTVEAWANGNTFGAEVVGAPLAAKGIFNIDDQFNLGIDSTKLHYRFTVRGANGTNYVVGSGSSPALDGHWHHIVGVCDEANGQLLLYFDGRLANIATIPTNSGVYEAPEPMTIGAGTVDGVNYTNQFDGYINDVAVYNYAMSFGQVAAQYSAIDVPPYIIQPLPANVTANAGGTLNLPTVAAGTTPLGYYWTDVSGGTNVAAGLTNGLPLNATLAVSNVPAGWNNDQLELTVTNAYGSTNVFVSLTVYTNAPQITTNIPLQITLLDGASYTYSVEVVGPTPYAYQWYNGATPIADQTNASYMATAGSPGNTTYYVVITNSYGANTSAVSTLTSVAAFINQNLPAQVRTLSGHSYTYSIGGIVGPSPYGYQWYNVATSIAGQTNSTYTATAGSPGSTTYYVVITNVYGAATSTVSTLTSIAQLTNAYAAGVLQFHPAGYWPMHEVAAAAQGDIETNYGTLGLLGTGYYPDWVANYGGMVRQVPGALFGDSDTAVGFTYGTGNAGSTVSFTNGVYVPHTSPLSTLNPPFSVECWFYPTNAPTGEAVWSQCGAVGLNDGAVGSEVNYNGLYLNWANGTFVPYGYDGYTNGGVTPNSAKLLGSLGTAGGSPTVPANHWYYLVVTCDADTNFTLYFDGSTVVGPRADVGLYSPDYWSPLTICSGPGGLRSTAGSLDEFAVYTTNLLAADILQHYNDGIGGGAGVYMADVLADNPVIYLRMDAPAYTPPDVSTWPQLVNYGSASLNGVYSPGTIPGIVAGPATNSVPFGGLSGTNVAQLSGVSSFADAGYDPAFNPTGSSKTLSVTAWFRGNPADGRIQTIIGHSDSSWRVDLTTNGTLQFAVGSDTVLTSTGVYNDGNWHQVVAVYDGAGGNEYLYVDGTLDSSSAVTGSSIAGSTLDVMIGTDPQYTNNPVGVGEQFAGQVCEAAFFTNALTAAQAQDIYSETIAPPVNTTPTNIVFSVTGSQLTLSWPADHTGWRLQAQTNSVSVGLGTNWVDVANSTTTNQVVIPLDANNGSVFYRLIYP